MRGPTVRVLTSVPASSSDPGLRDALSIVAEPVNLRRTLKISLIVGTVLFVINQADVVMGGDATMTTWAKICLTFVVPFVVSNLGVIHATRLHREHHGVDGVGHGPDEPPRSS